MLERDCGNLWSFRSQQSINEIRGMSRSLQIVTRVQWGWVRSESELFYSNHNLHTMFSHGALCFVHRCMQEQGLSLFEKVSDVLNNCVLQTFWLRVEEEPHATLPWKGLWSSGILFMLWSDLKILTDSALLHMRLLLAQHLLNHAHAVAITVDWRKNNKYYNVPQ